MIKECQSIGCSNIGIKVQCVIDVGGKEEVYDIYLCRVCQMLSNNVNRGLWKN